MAELEDVLIQHKNKNQSFAKLPNCKNVQRKKILEANGFRQEQKAKLRVQCTYYL
jgi:hypothetical protein